MMVVIRNAAPSTTAPAHQVACGRSGDPGRQDRRRREGRRPRPLGGRRPGGWRVAPGFINMLSWATESLIADGRSQSDIRQGRDAGSDGLRAARWGPLNPRMKADALKRQGDVKFPIGWTSLGEYLEMLEKKGVSTNVASFVGAETVRVHELGLRTMSIRRRLSSIA